MKMQTLLQGSSYWKQHEKEYSMGVRKYRSESGWNTSKIDKRERER